MKMPSKMKKKWLKALRSGEYGQTKEKLTDGKGGFCCLGVLQHVVSGGKVECQDNQFSDAYLDTPTKEWYTKNGIEYGDLGTGWVYSDDDEEHLIKMNDGDIFSGLGSKKFSTIANWIEKNIGTTDQSG